MQKDMPEVYKQLLVIRDKLEAHYRNVQDIEFTVQKGKLYMLQTRDGKRTGFAAVRIAVDMAEEGLITQKEAISVRWSHRTTLNQLLQQFSITSQAQGDRRRQAAGKGINAGPGAATGRIKFFADDAEAWVNQHGKPDAHGKRDINGRVVLVRRETSPEDIRGMQAADGILTALEARPAMRPGQPANGQGCVAGCGNLQIDYDKGT